jgi:hypothetical protein
MGPPPCSRPPPASLLKGISKVAVKPLLLLDCGRRSAPQVKISQGRSALVTGHVGAGRNLLMWACNGRSLRPLARKVPSTQLAAA